MAASVHAQVPMPRDKPAPAGSPGFQLGDDTNPPPPRDKPDPVDTDDGPLDDQVLEEAGIAAPPPREKPRAPLPPVPRYATMEEACGDLIAGLALEATLAPPIREGRCGGYGLLRVTGAGIGRSIPLSSPATLTCGMARSLSIWLSAAVDPAATVVLESRVASITTSASYVCRTRNNQPGARLSEHGFANALDISAFVLADGRRIAVRPYDTEPDDEDGADPEARFLELIREAACGPFKTVLGPGSDAFHDDHFHLDMAERRNGSTYCR